MAINLFDLTKSEAENIRRRIQQEIEYPVSIKKEPPKKSAPLSGYCFLVVSIESEQDLMLYIEAVRHIAKAFNESLFSLVRNTVCFTNKEFWKQHIEVREMCSILENEDPVHFIKALNWTNQTNYGFHGNRTPITYPDLKSGYHGKSITINNKNSILKEFNIYRSECWYLFRNEYIYEFNPDLVVNYHKSFKCSEVYHNPVYSNEFEESIKTDNFHEFPYNPREILSKGYKTNLDLEREFWKYDFGREDFPNQKITHIIYDYLIQKVPSPDLEFVKMLPLAGKISKKCGLVRFENIQVEVDIPKIDLSYPLKKSQDLRSHLKATIGDKTFTEEI